MVPPPIHRDSLFGFLLVPSPLLSSGSGSTSILGVTHLKPHLAPSLPPREKPNDVVMEGTVSGLLYWPVLFTLFL